MGEPRNSARHQVVVIGSGFSGIGAAIKLRDAGIHDFVILERSDRVGGTWRDNTYPGIAVDIPSFSYQFSFEQRSDWSRVYAPGDELKAYAEECVDAYGLRPKIRLNAKVTGAAWDDERHLWRLSIEDGDDVEARFVVGATGVFSQPKPPDVPGVGDFAGTTLHTSRWDHSVDLRGKRVALIGTGASAVQVIPSIAPDAAQLTVFQRTPIWVTPKTDFRIPRALQRLFAVQPWTQRLARRANSAWLEGMMVSAVLHYRQARFLNQAAAALSRRHLAKQVEDPELRRKLTPEYRLGCKRVLLSNDYFPALQKPNVEVVTDGIREISEKGVVTDDGVLHEVEVIVYGTGFQASKFLTPMTVTGRGGIDLHEQWAGDARAYLGITVPGFPNLFCLYGPNTNIVINGSIVYFSECETRYILGCVKLALEHGGHALEVRKDVHDAFNERVDAENRVMAWGASDVNSWYKNENGRVAQNWPFTLLEYWQRTLAPDPNDYELIP